MQPLYQHAYTDAFDEGYCAGHLDATRAFLIQKEAGTVREGIMASMKAYYEQRLQEAAATAKSAYQAGKADGYQEGAAAGRRERIAAILTHGAPADVSIARALAAEEASAELADRLRLILAQVKEGGPVAVAIAERIEAAL